MFSKILVIGWMFTAGWCPFDTTGYTYTKNTEYQRIVRQYNSFNDNSSHVGMAFNAVIIDHINVRGSIDSWQVPIEWSNWSPYRVKYGIGADVSLFKFDEQKFNVLLSIDRSCSHPLHLWSRDSGDTNTAYCEVRLTVKGTADIF